MPNPFTQALDTLRGSTVDLGVSRRSLPTKVQRAALEGTAVEYGRGSVMVARVRALEHVTDEALLATGRLSQLEGFWSRHTPHSGGRYQAIADLAAMAMADIVAETGRE